MRNHIHTVHELKLYSKAKEPMACPHCPREFYAKYDLWQHVTNRHTTLSATELESAKKINPALEVRSDETCEEYQYVPCPICGQAVLDSAFGMDLHYETLKPVMGLDMQCPACPSKFIEQRALFQHFKFCREKEKGIKPRQIHCESYHVDCKESIGN